MSLLFTIAAFLGALGILIVFHELGHYWVARRCGVKVLRFSLGFGRPLLRRKFGPDQTEWVLAAIPFGGYVAMLDEREAKTTIAPADLPRAFNRQSVGKRAAIVAAGPLANFLLAIVLYAGLNLHGIEEPRAILGAAPAGTLAAKAGLGGDGGLGPAPYEVRAVSGEAVRSMVDFRWKLLQQGVARETFVLDLIDATGQARQTSIDFGGVSGDDLDKDFMRQAGLVPTMPTPVLGELTPGGAAVRAGLQAGDIVLKVDGIAIGNAGQLVSAIRAAPGKALIMDIDRGGLAMRVSVTPDSSADSSADTGRNAGRDAGRDTSRDTSRDTAKGTPAVGKIGVAIRTIFPMTTVQYGPVEGLTRAVTQTWETSILTLRMLGKMLVGEVSLKNLSGPVTIADYAGQSARIGVVMYLTFLAFISISIGLMNLLPIPMLDGGHLLYYLVEIVLGRAPPERFIDWSQRAGMGMLAALMLIALFNDFTRLLS